ncbi:AMP-binding protein [Streptomyces sp. M19]
MTLFEVSCAVLGKEWSDACGTRPWPGRSPTAAPDPRPRRRHRPEPSGTGLPRHGPGDRPGGLRRGGGEHRMTRRPVDPGTSARATASADPATPAGAMASAGALWRRVRGGRRVRRTRPQCGAGGVWTYRQLELRVAALARGLAALAGPGDVVAATTRTVWGAVLTTLAASATGACVLPLGPAEPPARRAFALRDAGRPPNWPRRKPSRKPGPGAGPGTGPGRHRGDRSAGDTGSVPRDAAYLLYTSGSTGRPKG